MVLRIFTKKVAGAEGSVVKTREISQAKSILTNACNKSLRLSIVINERHETYLSMFVDIATEGEDDFLIIDSLTPKVVRSLLEPNVAKLTARFTIDGVPSEFTSTFEEFVKWDGFEALRLRLPDTVKTIQKREHFRVEPKFSEPVVVKFTNPIVELATVVDISEGGLYLRLENQVNNSDVLQFNLSLPAHDVAWLGLKAKVVGCGELSRVIDHDTTSKSYYARLKFHETKPVHSQDINRFVIERQRENLKLFS